jgi:hypothetical protein
MFGIHAKVHLSSVKLSTTCNTLLWEEYNTFHAQLKEKKLLTKLLQ